MNSTSRAQFGRFAFGAYLFLVLIVLPLLSPLRALGIIEPGELRNMLLPPLFLMVFWAFGGVRLLPARTLLHVGLIFAFVQAALIGLPNAIDPVSQRSYLSHLFQVASAYVLLSAGWLAIDWFGHNFWKKFAVLALVATLISTVFTLSALQRGDLGRLYTPAYAFLFVAAFSAIHSTKMSAISILGLLVSNKRGPIVSVLLIFGQYMFGRFVTAGKMRSVRFLVPLFWGMVIAAALLVSVVALVNWAATPGNDSTAVGKAVNITYGRMIDVVQAGNSGRTLDEVSAGRVEEIENAMENLEGFDFVVGSGAGWSITTPDGKQVQNIHFSPLSITAVFGAPFAIFIYLYLMTLVFRGTVRKTAVENLSTTERMAPLYLSGALLHSLFAYSLFIDWLVFFFAGVLLKSLNAKRKRFVLSREVPA